LGPHEAASDDILIGLAVVAQLARMINTQADKQTHKHTICAHNVAIDRMRASDAV